MQQPLVPHACMPECQAHATAGRLCRSAGLLFLSSQLCFPQQWIPSALPQTADGTVFPRLRPGAYNDPATLQLRRSPMDPSFWLLMCGYFIMSEAAGLPTLLAELGLQPGQLGRLLFYGVEPPPAQALAAWPQLPGVERLILQSSRFPLDALLPLLPRLQVRCAVLCRAALGGHACTGVRFVTTRGWPACLAGAAAGLI